MSTTDSPKLNNLTNDAQRERCIQKISNELIVFFNQDSLPVFCDFLKNDPAYHSGSIIKKEEMFTTFSLVGDKNIVSSWNIEQLSLNNRLQLNNYEFYDTFLLFPLPKEEPISVTLYADVYIPNDTETLRKFVDGESVSQRELDALTKTVRTDSFYDKEDPFRPTEQGGEAIFIPLKTVFVHPLMSSVFNEKVYTFSLYDHPLPTNSIPFQFVIQINYKSQNDVNMNMNIKAHTHVMSRVYVCSGHLYSFFQKSVHGFGGPLNKMTAMRLRFPHCLASGFGC